MCVLFLSLAGIPPFFGFFPKLILINLMIDIYLYTNSYSRVFNKYFLLFKCFF